jgi:hypothetical protein
MKTTIKIISLTAISIKTLFKFSFFDEKHLYNDSEEEKALKLIAKNPVFGPRDL